MATPSVMLRPPYELARNQLTTLPSDAPIMHLATKTVNWHAVGYRWQAVRPGERGGPLLDHLGGLEEDVPRDGEAEGLGGLEVDHEVEGRRLLHGKVGGLGALEDAVHVVRGTSQ